MTGATVIALGVGRPRKPSSVKARQGTERADRRNGAEPAARFVPLPPPPEYLTATERECWIRHAAVVDAWRVASAADVRAFERLVEIDALITEAQRSMRRDLGPGGVPRLFDEVATRNGQWIQPRQEIGLITRLEKLLLFYFSRFGLTPADRARVAALPSSDGGATPLDEFAGAAA